MQFFPNYRITLTYHLAKDLLDSKEGAHTPGVRASGEKCSDVWLGLHTVLLFSPLPRTRLPRTRWGENRGKKSCYLSINFHKCMCVTHAVTLRQMNIPC
jgi:hypothetical protein